MKPTKMMELLHAIRVKHWAQVKSLGRNERVAMMRREAEAVKMSIRAGHAPSSVAEKGPEYGGNARQRER